MDAVERIDAPRVAPALRKAERRPVEVDVEAGRGRGGRRAVFVATIKSLEPAITRGVGGHRVLDERTERRLVGEPARTERRGIELRPSALGAHEQMLTEDRAQR